MTMRPRRPTSNNSNNDSHTEDYKPSDELIKNNKENLSVNISENTDQSQRYQELKKKQINIQKERAKREFEYEHSKKQLKICEEEAAALGVSSIEELEELIIAKEKEEKDILDKFENDLIKEEQALKNIENNLNN